MSYYSYDEQERERDRYYSFEESSKRDRKYLQDRQRDESLLSTATRCLVFLMFFFLLNAIWFALLFLFGGLPPQQRFLVFLIGAVLAGITWSLGEIERRYINKVYWEEIGKEEDGKKFKQAITGFGLAVSACVAVFIWIHLYFYLALCGMLLFFPVLLAGAGGGVAGVLILF